MLDRLSTLTEVQTVLNKGIVRQIPRGKADIHYCDFAPLVNLLTRLDISAELFTKDLPYEQVVVAAPEVLGQLARSLTGKKVPEKLLNEVYDYLAEEDPPRKVDFIVVFGAYSLINRRIQKAAGLLSSGLAPLVYFAGSRPIEDPDREHEGRKFREIAINQFKVDPRKIHVDPYENSMTIADNVRGFLNYNDCNRLGVESVAVVVLNHVLRRSWAGFKKYTVDGFGIVRCSAGQKPGVTREDWFKNLDGVRLIFDEYLKMKVGQLTNTC